MDKASAWVEASWAAECSWSARAAAQPWARSRASLAGGAAPIGFDCEHVKRTPQIGMARCEGNGLSATLISKPAAH